MPRYYFHVSAPGLKRCLDPEGQDLDDLTAAYYEAIISAREILAELVRSGKIVDGQRYEIADAEGKVLLVVPFKSALAQ